VPPSQVGSQSPRTRGQRALFGCVHSFAGRVLTCMTIGAAATAENSPLWRRQDAGIPAHASRRCPTQVRLPSRVNRLDVSDDGTYFRLIAPPGEPQLGLVVGVIHRVSAQSCFSAVRGLRRRRGPWSDCPAPGRLPSSSRGRGGALDTLEAAVRFKAAVEGRRLR